jgi:hypothetical protein
MIKCGFGNREKMALNEMCKLNVSHHGFSVYEGGLMK